MKNVAMLSKRFGELAAEADDIEASKIEEGSDYGPYSRIDSRAFLTWKVNARNLISLACTAESEHYREFLKQEIPQSLRWQYDEFRDVLAVFNAARADFEGGYLNSVRNLVQADVFGSELDQATELLAAGYDTAAAVIAGVVLETALRQLCDDRSIAVGKLDKMNADLAKAGVYNSLVQKRITALAGIRNAAAHGHPGAFKRDDVVDMIRQVENFLADHL